MLPIASLGLSLLLLVALLSSNTIFVQNKCPESHPVVLRGACGTVLAQDNIDPGQTWTSNFDANNCASCNIGTNTGGTLLAECTGGKIWWNLSTDAGYQYPPFRFFSSPPNAANMYCGDPQYSDGTPGDSHINNVGDQTI